MDDGRVEWRCAIDEDRIDHAFGSTGRSLFTTARSLCNSLAESWSKGSIRAWKPPFERASITEPVAFTAQSVDSAITHVLGQHSSLHTLLAQYEIPESRSTTGIVAKVRRSVKSRHNSEHLARFFLRNFAIDGSTLPLRVDFFGRRLACYIVLVTTSDKQVDVSSERGLGKMAELHALRSFTAHKRTSLGLLEDERPSEFELLMVGSEAHPIQGRVMQKIQMLADMKHVRARALPDADAAATHLIERERAAA